MALDQQVNDLTITYDCPNCGNPLRWWITPIDNKIEIDDLREISFICDNCDYTHHVDLEINSIP